MVLLNINKYKCHLVALQADKRCIKDRRRGGEKGEVSMYVPGFEGKKEMFYLTTHSTHFIYGYMASHMVKDHLYSERGNPLPPHGLLFPISSKGSLICIIPQTG